MINNFMTIIVIAALMLAAASILFGSYIQSMLAILVSAHAGYIGLATEGDAHWKVFVHGSLRRLYKALGEENPYE